MPAINRGISRGGSPLVLGMAAIAVAFASVPSTAGATTTFGANLSRTANASFTCSVLPPFNISSGASTCTWETITSALGTTNESFVVPSGNGKVSKVRVKVGAVTGPMQVVVMRALRQPNAPPDSGAACCKAVAMSGVFTPTANSTTAFDTDFAVRNDQTPDPASGLFNFDQLGLSVLQAGVPVPANDTGNFGGTGPVDNVFFPAWQQVGQERADGAGLEGYVVLMNADWDDTGDKRPDAPPTSAVTLARPTALVKRGSALLDIVCNLGTTCDGQVELASQQPGTAAAARKKKKRSVSYGKSKFTIAAGQTGTVKVKLSKRGRKLLRKRRSAKVWATFKVTGSTTAVPSAQVSLKR